jgi:aldehyde dehydrogenase family 7 protein A1
VEKISKVYKTISIGNPLDDSTLVGPLHNRAAVEKFQKTIQTAKA